MSRGTTRFATLTGPADEHWPAFRALYHRAFPAAEREPDPVLAERARAGRYRVRLALDGRGAVTGCYVVDVAVEADYALLCYVAVEPRWRRSGVGRRLCLDAVAWFRAEAPAQWLLVEAAPRAAQLYRRCGFTRLALDYQVPYIHASGMQVLQLLVLASDGQAGTMPGQRLRAIIRHLFVDGYLVSPDDPRLQAQLARVPDQTRIEDAPIPAAG